MKLQTAVKVAFVLSVLPIWRQGSNSNLNFWEMVQRMAAGVPHIPYTEAVQKAHDAYVISGQV